MTLITLNNEPLPKLMHAVVLVKPHQLKYSQIPVWPIEEYNDPDLILVKVKACGVCGSDFRYYQGENPWAQHTAGIHIQNPPNIVLGHEYTGEVVAVLDEKNRKLLGKRVVSICSKVCGKCVMCTTNRAHLCQDTIHMGHGQGWGKLAYYPGAYAEYVPAWGAGTFEIPSEVSFEEAAMMDVLAVSTHAFQQTNHFPNKPILLIGCGPIGNGIGQVAKNKGIEDENIIIIENSPIAAKVAKDTGFNIIIDSNDKEPAKLIEYILKSTNNKKAFSVFDSIGTELSFEIGLGVLDKGGTYVNLAVHDQKVTNFNQMQLSSERKITTSSNFSLSAFKQAWEWLGEGKFSINPWLTKIALKEVPQIFADITKNKKGREYFKIIIQED